MVKKIDFHIHTVSSEKDYDFNFSLEWLKNYVNEAELDAIAITNHDLFDCENFNYIKSSLSDVKVFPGIELSLETGHVNIIFSENEVDNLKDFSSWLSNYDFKNNKTITVDEYCHNMKNWEKGIYIFEMGKSNSLRVPDKLQSVTKVGGVANQLKFQLFFKNYNKKKLTPVLFSDAHASYDDPEEKRRNIKVLKTKNTYIQVDSCNFDEIKNCISDITKVHINNNSLKDVIEINGHYLSTGINLIVGKRGTGKTHFLNEVKNFYENEEYYEIAQFQTAKADEYLSKQKESQGQEAFKKWKDTYNTQLNGINQYLSEDLNRFDGEIEKYLDSLKQFAKDLSHSNSQSKYKIFKDVHFEISSTDTIKRYLESLLSLINNTEMWELVKDSQTKRKYFIQTYMEIRAIFLQRSKISELQKKVNDILISASEIVSDCTGISRPTDCKLIDIIKKHQTEVKINHFLTNELIERNLKREDIHGYQIVVKVTPYQSADQFKATHSTKEAVKDELITPYKKGDYIKFLHNLKNKKFFKPQNLGEYLMRTEVMLLDEEGTAASGGQAVGFALMMRLEEAKHHPIVLIDEPEASLDNSYISSELIDALKNLSNHSTVFVITHNSTLGALLNPDYLVITSKNEDNSYNVATGEFSSAIIKNKQGISEYSYDKFVEAMESGIKNYHKKGEVYGNLKI